MLNDRVLSRLHARPLTEKEMTEVKGAIIGTGPLHIRSKNMRSGWRLQPGARMLNIQP